MGTRGAGRAVSGTCGTRPTSVLTLWGGGKGAAERAGSGSTGGVRCGSAVIRILQTWPWGEELTSSSSSL